MICPIHETVLSGDDQCWQCFALETRYCGLTGTHFAHEYQRRGWVESILGWVWVPKEPTYLCPGLPHVPHDQRCCTMHDTHSMPHMGCVLR